MEKVSSYKQVFVALEGGGTLCIGPHFGMLKTATGSTLMVNMQVSKALRARQKLFDVCRHTPTEERFTLNADGVQVGRQYRAQGVTIKE